MKLSDLLAGTTPAPAPVAEHIEVPDLMLPLLDYQRDAVRFVLDRDASLVALDMGLGKTAVAIAVAVAHAERKDVPVLVVVPPSLTTNWVREFHKFAPQISTAVLKGTKPHALPDAQVLIIGESVVASWAKVKPEDRTEHDLHDKIRVLIADESHLFKNYKAGRTRAMTSLAGSTTGRKVLMSGTPMPNGRVDEMSSQISILGPDAWRSIGGLGKFRERYTVRTQWGTESTKDPLLLAEFNSLISGTLMVRQLREDVLDLPAKGRIGVTFDGRGPAVRAYKAAEQDLIAYLRQEGKATRGAERAEALVRLTTLRRLAGEAKVEAIAQHVEQLLESPGGVFVVAEHNQVMNALSQRLSKHGLAEVRGGMSQDAKTEAVDAFTSGKARVMVGQIKAAGVGLTLHGGGLNYRVVIAQLPWSPSDLRQAEDRLHRIGQTNDVVVEVALCHIEGMWTIDERLWGTLEQKAFDTGIALDGVAPEALLDEVTDAVLDSYR